MKQKYFKYEYKYQVLNKGLVSDLLSKIQDNIGKNNFSFKDIIQEYINLEYKPKLSYYLSLLAYITCIKLEDEHRFYVKDGYTGCLYIVIKALTESEKLSDNLKRDEYGVLSLENTLKPSDFDLGVSIFEALDNDDNYLLFYADKIWPDDEVAIKLSDLREVAEALNDEYSTEYDTYYFDGYLTSRIILEYDYEMFDFMKGKGE